jgi:glycosyltransferase involved in cell wall biosynthesis
MQKSEVPLTGAIDSASRRWLVLTQYYPPEIGAPQIRLQAMVHELGRKGIEVEVITALPNYPAGIVFPSYKGKWRVRETIAGVPVRRTWVYAATGKSAVIRLSNYFSFTFTALLSTLTGPRPDVLFVESQPLSLGLVAVLMKWLRGVRYIYNVPDLQVDVARQLGFMRSNSLLQLAFGLENFFLRNSWKVSTVTHGFIDHFQSRGLPRSQITFLPNGADSNFLKPMPPAQDLLDRWKLHGKKIFLYVGTHAFYHGLENLIEAATLLRERDDIAFLMIGDGPERERLMTMCTDRGLTNVVFGRSPYDEMDRLYSIAFASVATLRKMEVAKGMRLSKIFPSLSCAVPVIYAGEGEAAELLREHECGLLVPPENPELLSRAIASFAADRETRDQFGKTGRALVEREYSWNGIVGRWLDEIGVMKAGTDGLRPSNRKT